MKRLSELLYTLRILYHYWRTRRLAGWTSKPKLMNWQEQKIIQHIRRIRKQSPFYHQWWQGIPDHQWRDFPLIDKSIMMEHFDQLNTLGITKEEAMQIADQAEQTRDFEPTIQGVTIGLSSGTSGNRGLFLVSPQEQAQWTGTVLAKLLPGGIRQQQKIAFFLRANSNLYESVQKGKLQFRYFDLLVPLSEHIQQLESYRPSLLIAPASMLRLLAEQKTAGLLTIQPQKIISVAEVLDPLDREYIESVFAQNVHQVYQCTEGFLAATCAYGHLHLNEDIVHIQKEILDEQSRRFVPIVTDFSRRSQPIIRYRLNDILTESVEPCPCGSPMLRIERIEGRYDDIIYVAHQTTEELVPLFPDLITRAIIGASPAIEHYRVIQYDSHQLEISYRLTGNKDYVAHDEAVEAKIIDRIQHICDTLQAVTPVITFTAYEFTPGIVKLRRVERKWKL
ncbi:F390 synthetase-related protein [Paenibacillus kyungheensis]